MVRIIHKTAAFLALTFIATFFLSTIIVEIFGSRESIIMVKTAILYAIPLLIIAMMVTGISGAKLGKNNKSERILRKKKRMPIIAGNGIFILVPSAYFLHSMVISGEFGTPFYLLQAVELFFGGLNMFLMIQSIKDGKRAS